MTILRCDAARAKKFLRSSADGDWCLLCGDEHKDDPSAYRVVGIGHILERDPTINALLDLPPEWEAERNAEGDDWHQQLITDSDDGNVTR